MYRDVRIQEAGNKLAFRFDPESDMIEVSIRGQLYTISLREYRNGDSLTHDAESARIPDR